MRLRCHVRRKDDKEHRYCSIAEKYRCVGARSVDRHGLYLGEVNESQQACWAHGIDAFEAGTHR